MATTGTIEVNAISASVPNGASTMQRQSYDLFEEATLAIDRAIAPGEMHSISILPDIDVANAVRFLNIVGTANLSFNLAVRSYTSSKSAITAGNGMSFQGTPLLILGTDISGSALPGELTLAVPFAIHGGAQFAMLLDNGNNLGAPRIYSDTVALPMTLTVKNRGQTTATVSIRAIYDPTPGSHVGTKV